jgi:hypothetical protein
VIVRPGFLVAYPDTVQSRLRAVDPSGPQSSVRVKDSRWISPGLRRCWYGHASAGDLALRAWGRATL